MRQTTEPGPGSGIPRSLAEQRRRALRQLRYRLELDLPADPQAPIAGRAVLSFELAAGSAWPVIDFAPGDSDREAAAHIRRIGIAGDDAPFTIERGHIVLGGMPTAGPQCVEIDFIAGSSALTRRAGLIYSLFVPARAHSVFPCFDQPDLKAPLELSLTMPADWNALANAPELDRSVDGNRLEVRFAPTEPLPTYLFAWVAGELALEERSIGRYRLRMLHAEQDEATLARNRDELFALHARALELLEAYTDIPQPFPQFAFVLIPDFQFGGMEHPGAIFYRRSLLLLGQDAGEPERLRRANLIAHETAHLWFGDLVTMPWFDDVWLKEVFANFMADKFTAQTFPGVDHELEFVLKHFPAAYSIDRTAGTHAIRQTLDNLNAAGELYDALVYHKAPIALAQLEQETGAPALQRGVRRYLHDHRFQTADWPALLDCLQPETERDVRSWSREWIESAGPPAAGPIDWDRPRYGRIALSQTDRLAALDWLEHDGHYAGPEAAAVRRAGAWIALYEDMLGRGIEPSRVLAAALKALSLETEPLLTARLLHDAGEIHWRHLTTVQRGAAASAVERVLRLRANQADANERRPVWLRALIGFAQTPETIAELESVWLAREYLGTALTEPLEIRLALTLALHRPARAEELLATQTGRTADRDRRARLKFLTAAVAPARATRDAFFARLIDGGDRELWAVAGLGWLNHPLCADRALHYLVPGLEHAARLRAQGHIFLPRQWLEALFSGHASRMAADAVNDFLQASRPSIAPRLRNLILQTADPLLRAAAQS